MKIYTEAMLQVLKPKLYITDSGEYTIDRQVVEGYQANREFLMSESQFAEEVTHLSNYLKEELKCDYIDADIITFQLIMHIQSRLIAPSKRFRLYESVVNIIEQNGDTDFEFGYLMQKLMGLNHIPFVELIKSDELHDVFKFLKASDNSKFDLRELLEDIDNVIEFD